MGLGALTNFTTPLGIAQGLEWLEKMQRMERTRRKQEQKESVDKEIREMMERGKRERMREYEEVGRNNEVRKIKKGIRKFVRHMNQEARRLEAEADRLEAKGISTQIKDYLAADEESTSGTRGHATHYLNENGELKEIEDPRKREERLAERNEAEMMELGMIVGEAEDE